MIMFINLPPLDENFNYSYNEFVRTIKLAIDKHAPLKEFTRRQRSLTRKPWLNKGIMTSIRKKNSLFKSHFIKGNEAQKFLFKQYTNKLTKVKTLSEKVIFLNEIH